MLLIRGAAVSRDVPLTAEELRAGTVVYSAPVDQTRFQLSVVAGGLVAREFLTVVMPQAADAPPSRATVPVRQVVIQKPMQRPGSLCRVSRRRPANSSSSNHSTARIPRRTSPVVWTNPHPSAARGLVNAGTPALLNRPALSPIAPPVSQPQTQAQDPVSSQPPAEVPAAESAGPGGALIVRSCAPAANASGNPAASSTASWSALETHHRGRQRSSGCIRQRNKSRSCGKARSAPATPRCRRAGRAALEIPARTVQRPCGTCKYGVAIQLCTHALRRTRPTFLHLVFIWL